MKYIVDIHGEIEGDYEIIGKYEERPQGEWINDMSVYLCGNCGMESKYKSPFCPYCGADMRGNSYDQ